MMWDSSRDRQPSQCHRNGKIVLGNGFLSISSLSDEQLDALGSELWVHESCLDRTHPPVMCRRLRVCELLVVDVRVCCVGLAKHSDSSTAQSVAPPARQPGELRLSLSDLDMMLSQAFCCADAVGPYQ